MSSVAEARPPSVESRAVRRSRDGWTRRTRTTRWSRSPGRSSPRNGTGSRRARTGRDVDELAGSVARAARASSAAATPPPTINATGVIVHTNLGRAPWPQAAIEAAAAAAGDYLLLELDRDDRPTRLALPGGGGST